MILEPVITNCGTVLNVDGNVLTEPFLSTCDHVLPFIGMWSASCMQSDHLQPVYTIAHRATAQHNNARLLYRAAVIAAAFCLDSHTFADKLGTGLMIVRADVSGNIEVSVFSIHCAATCFGQ